MLEILLVAAAAAAASSVATTDVSIVYTGHNLGVHSTWSDLTELLPLFAPKYRTVFTAGGLQYDVGTLRRDRWYLWGAAKPLTASAAAALFEGGGIAVLGPGTPVAALESEFGVVFQVPDGGGDGNGGGRNGGGGEGGGNSDWLVPWLDERLRENGDHTDVHRTKGALFSARSAGGVALRLFSEDGSPPNPEILHDKAGWSRAGGVRSTIRRDQGESHLVGLARRFGGYAVFEAARRLTRAHDALRVDAGGLVDNSNDMATEFDLADTLDEVDHMDLDALVPYKYELYLSRPDLLRLAKAAPLVAANLTPPPGIPLRPYVIRERHGVRVAIVGIADGAKLEQYGLLGQRTGWKAEDPEKALRKALASIRLDRADAVVLVTNVAEGRLVYLRYACEGCAAIVSSATLHLQRGFKERFEPADPGRTRYPLPWLVAGARAARVGRLALEFATGTGAPVLRAVSNAGQLVGDDEPVPADKVWRDFALASDFVEARRDLVLPDIRRLATRAKPLLDENGDPQIVMTGERWSALAAASLRRATGAEVAIIHNLTHGKHLTGDIPRFIAEEWLPNGVQAATAQLTGAEIKKLLATDGDRSKFTIAGFDVDQNLVGGRKLADDERYLVAIDDSIATNEAFENVFHDQARTALRRHGDRVAPIPRVPHGQPGENVSLRDIVMAHLEALWAKHGEFDDAYLDDLAPLFADDGHRFEPRWTVAAKPCEGAFQQLSITNRDAFATVRNSRVNAPNNTSIRGKGNLAVTYEAADFDWENKALAEYQRAEIQLPAATLTQKGADNVTLTSEFRMKVFKLETPRSALELVPFVNGNYLTEFTPTDDPKTGKSNPRRSEFNGIAGVVLYPRTWVKEVRMGAIAKRDLAVATRGFEPGVQLATSLEYPLGTFSWTLDADVKNYFRTAFDTADDLGLLAQVGTGVRFPLFGAFSLRVGVDALYFTAKVGDGPPTGTSIVPAIGVAYNATWKPGVGLVY